MFALVAVSGLLLLTLGPGVALAQANRAAVSASTRASQQREQRYRASKLLVSGVLTLKATQIIGTNAHLSLLPDPLHPKLTFSVTTLQGFQLRLPSPLITLTLSSPDVVTTTDVVIKTSIFRDLVTALQSFTNKLDLLTLVAGGTVKRLVMTNVTLAVDTYIRLGTMNAPLFQLASS